MMCDWFLHDLFRHLGNAVFREIARMDGDNEQSRLKAWKLWDEPGGEA